MVVRSEWHNFSWKAGGLCFCLQLLEDPRNCIFPQGTKEDEKGGFSPKAYTYRQNTIGTVSAMALNERINGEYDTNERTICVHAEMEQGEGL